MYSVGGALLAYTVAAALLTITPGLDTALVLRTAASEGPRRALWSGLGRPSVVRGLDRMTGGIFIAFGARLAAESRHAQGAG